MQYVPNFFGRQTFFSLHMTDRNIAYKWCGRELAWERAVLGIRKVFTMPTILLCPGANAPLASGYKRKASFHQPAFIICRLPLD